MQQSNLQTAFYVVSLNAERTKFSLVNYRTETVIFLNVSREDISLFLQDNEPCHPFLGTKVSGDVKDYLATYNIYNTSYQNPYTKQDGPSDFGSFSYLVSDNDIVANTITPSTSNQYPDSSGTHQYRDNDIPYISGMIGHRGD